MKLGCIPRWCSVNRKDSANSPFPQQSLALLLLNVRRPSKTGWALASKIAAGSESWHKASKQRYQNNTLCKQILL